MSNWRIISLKDIGTFERGKGLQKSDFTDSGMPCIHYGQIFTYYGGFTNSTISFVSPETAKECSIVHHGDTILAITSENVQDLCKSTVWIGDEDIVTGGHSGIFRHNQNPKFLGYYFQSEYFNHQKAKYAKGTKVIEINPEDILNRIKIKLPDLETQQKIVQILDTWNTSINKLKELSEKEKSYFDSQCKLLLSQNNNQTINYKLSDICSYKKGSGLSKEMLTNKGLPCILYGELYTHYDYLIDKVYSKIPITTIGVKSTMDDILIPASTTTNGKDLAIASVIKHPDVLLGGDINIFRIKDTNTVDGTFLALYLRYIKWRKMASRAQGITIVHLYGKDLLDLKIELPPLGIQKKVVSVINCQREKINIINDYIIKLEQQYKYLLNHLISGDFDLTIIKLEKGKEQL